MARLTFLQCLVRLAEYGERGEVHGVVRLTAGGVSSAGAVGNMRIGAPFTQHRDLLNWRLPIKKN